MLDLSVLKEKYWELKMFDGEVLMVKRPSQKMVVDMMSYEDTFKAHQKNPKLMIEAFVDMLSEILNNNANGIKYSREYIAEHFDFTVGMAVVEGYMTFVTEINSDPNS